MRIICPDMTWRLTGADMPACAAQAPLTIDHALELAGLLPDRLSGMGALEREWAQHRAFALEGVFTLDDWDCERTYIEFGHLLGAGRVCLNGDPIGDFAGGAAVLDATACAAPGVNVLRVEFAPGRERGVMGDVRVRGCWSLHVRSWTLESAAEGVCARVRVSAHAAGRYAFRYAVSRGADVVGTYTFEEKLGARCAEVSHVLPTGAPDEYRVDTPSLTCVRLSVLRAGETCDERTGWVAGAVSDEPRRTAAVSGAECAGERLGMLLDMGLRRFIADEDAHLPEDFLRRADECGAVVCTPCAPAVPHACLREAQPESELLRVSGMRRVEPPARPIPEIALRTLGGAELTDGPLSGLYSGDMARMSRIMRYVQAQTVACAAESAPQTAFDLRSGYEALVSPDLFDGAQPRPAYHALRRAWRGSGAYALTGGIAFDCGAQVSVPICVRGGGISGVRAELFDQSGRALSRAEFACTAQGQIGELMFTLGDRCEAYLLRLTAAAETGDMVRDYPICVRGAHELSALAALPTVRVKQAGDECINMDEVIAFGPVRADGGSALLPGEKAALLCSEGVNAMSGAALP